MYFDLTDEQEAIRSTAKDFLASRFKSERMREIAGSDDGTDAAGLDRDGGARLGRAGAARGVGRPGARRRRPRRALRGDGLRARALAALLQHRGRAGARAGRLRRAEGALAAAARRGDRARHPGDGRRGLDRDAGRLPDEGRGRRRRDRARRQEGAGRRRGRRRLLPRRHLRRPPPHRPRRRRRGQRLAGDLDRHHPPPLDRQLRRRQGRGRPDAARRTAPSGSGST